MERNFLTAEYTILRIAILNSNSYFPINKTTLWEKFAMRLNL